MLVHCIWFSLCRDDNILIPIIKYHIPSMMYHTIIRLSRKLSPPPGSYDPTMIMMTTTRELWSHHDQLIMMTTTRELWSHHDHDDHHQGVMVPPTSWRGDNECSSWPPQFPGSLTSAKVSIFVVFFIIFLLVQRVVKMFVAVVLVFAFSWLPYHLFFLLSYHFPQVSVVFRLLHSSIRICKSPWEIWLWWWQK